MRRSWCVLALLAGADAESVLGRRLQDNPFIHLPTLPDQAGSTAAEMEASADNIKEQLNAHMANAADVKEELKSTVASVENVQDELNGHLTNAADVKEELKNTVASVENVQDELNGHLAKAADAGQKLENQVSDAVGQLQGNVASAQKAEDKLGGVVANAAKVKDQLSGMMSAAGGGVSNIASVLGLGALGSGVHDLLGAPGNMPRPPISTSNGTTSIHVPCYLFIQPCGDVMIPPQGIDFTFPLGHYHTKGSEEITQELQQTEHAFSQYTLYVACLIGAYFLYRDIRSHFLFAKTSKPSRSLERSLSRSDLRIKYGLIDISDDEGEEELQKERQNRMDINSEDFLATGNIYRVLAVMHPLPLPSADPKVMPKAPIAGWKWLGIAGQGFICAYMQIFLPSKILMDCLGKWDFSGVKSPLWFLANGFTFVMMFGSTAALCNIFRGRAEAYIGKGAEANYYITTHRLPMTDSEARQAKDYQEKNPFAIEVPVGELDVLASSSESESDADEELSVCAGFFQVVKMWWKEQFSTCCGCTGVKSEEDMSFEEEKATEAAAMKMNAILISSKAALHAMVRINEIFWCTVSLVMSVVVSTLLVVCMFLKIATYTGEIAKIAIVAMSLYFIFDLEHKLFEANPKLRGKYRVALKEQVILRKSQCVDRISLHVAALVVQILRFLGPLGLFGIVVVAWKNTETGYVIGGSGLDA